MVSVKVASVAGFVALFATAASAADMPQPPPIYIPPVEEVAAGWYLRGDIGMSNQKVKSLHNVLYNSATSVTTVHKDFDSGFTFGLGFGYQWNHWFRTDFTGEYRGKTSFHGLDIVRSGGAISTDEYRGQKSEWLMLANAYIDLGTWWCVTPFIGAGIGASYNTISSFIDVNTPNQGVAYGATASQWNFAWAAHAGLSFKVNPQLSLEFAYRYVSLGDALSGDLITFNGGNAVNNPMEFRNITSHDLKFGVRWLLDAPVQHAPQPIMLPPLMRRG
jgi:opacity protein-like surface antigen